MSKKDSPEIIDMTADDLKALKARIKNKKMLDEDYSTLEKTIDFVVWIQIKLLHTKISMHNLKSLIFGTARNKKKTQKSEEKTAPEPKEPEEPKSNSEEPQPLEDQAEISTSAETPNDTQNRSEKEKQKGHGRTPAENYIPETIVHVKHSNLSAKDPCPVDFCKGTLYKLPITPGGIIRVQGRSCARVLSYHFYRLRCALCGATFTPPKPEGFSEEKYDERFKAILAVNKYFLATPFFRQESFYQMLKFPLSDATQWDCIEKLYTAVFPVFPALEKIAANFSKANHDDTTVKILSVIIDNLKNPDKKRRGSYTTCIIAREASCQICLYYSGVKHGGEHFDALLDKRDPGLEEIRQMCDALPANSITKHETILSHCLAHGHRKFKDLKDFFEEECFYMIERFQKVFGNEAYAKAKKLSDEKRLEYHKNNSAIPMEELRLFIEEGFSSKKIEPSSPLGKAMRYTHRQ